MRHHSALVGFGSMEVRRGSDELLLRLRLRDRRRLDALVFLPFKTFRVLWGGGVLGDGEAQKGALEVTVTSQGPGLGDPRSHLSFLQTSNLISACPVEM